MIRKGLIIAGHDPSGGAGLLMDTKVFSSLGIYAAAVPTAIVVEDTDRVQAVIGVETPDVGAQLRIMLRHVRFDGTKIGMLCSARTIELLVRTIERHNLRNVVLDPVLLSSGGVPLLGHRDSGALLPLFPLCTVVTPNVHEASALSGIRIRSRDDMVCAARYFMEAGAGAVVIKGGHFVQKGLDLYMDRKHRAFLEGTAIDRDVHGTGCILSSAIAAFLIKGYGAPQAVRLAKTFTEAAIKNSLRLSTSLKRYVGMPGK
ncbi:MAG: bifunctional hydroxymethylpyrimidine kinase/phosphomethylpyrimidine kinase [Deltaproteobacteria bacterium]|nr:bifunctional hydroxymethylpyrimidine kinase/phosphomethylpyrimidine kinase [Deltaproteobacteria bacterium]